MSNDSENTRDDGDLIWGAANIGAEISRTEDQLLYLLKIGALQGAVKKLGPRILVGSRAKLREFVNPEKKVDTTTA